jgi:hypothetical protein
MALKERTLSHIGTSSARFLRTLARRPTSRESREAIRFFAVVAALFGAVLVLVAAQSLTLRFFARETMGTVQRNTVETLQIVSNGPAGTPDSFVHRRFVDYVFTASNGERYVGGLSMGEVVNGFEVGTSVPVRYLPGSPGHNYLEGVNPPSLWSTLRILLGVALLLLAFWLFRVAHKAPKKPEPIDSDE